MKRAMFCAGSLVVALAVVIAGLIAILLAQWLYRQPLTPSLISPQMEKDRPPRMHQRATA